jgi:uncharacterized membrane protein
MEPHIASLLRRRATRNINKLRAEEEKTVGERMADRLAAGAGSWTFILVFLGFLAVWMAVNAVAFVHHWDPYPFILLNLLLSCVAALQAPIILMSQNRQEARDRLRAELDYEVNLKAEVLLEHLTEEVEVLKALLTQAQAGSAAGASDPPSAASAAPDLPAQSSTEATAS